MNNNYFFKKPFNFKLIYVYSINHSTHNGSYKIGETTVNNIENWENILPNSKILNDAAKTRINNQTITSGIEYKLEYTELAVFKNKSNHIISFSDTNVHDVLIRSGIKRKKFNTEKSPREWFETDLETIKNAIKCIKLEKNSLTNNEISSNLNPIKLLPSQEDFVKKTISSFNKKNKRFLWNAKMRFGKTITALELIKRMKFKKTLIITHRPVVEDGWYKDFKKIFYEKDNLYEYSSKERGEELNKLIINDKPFIYFSSIQDLRGSNSVGGKFDKNEQIFNIEWDLVIVDETHEGTKTEKGKKLIDNLNKDNTFWLLLSGTPYNWINEFNEENSLTWDYIMEQKAKKEWSKYYLDHNPYEDLPKMNIYTYELSKEFIGYTDIIDKAFNFKEFFRTWTGDFSKDKKHLEDNKIGKFIHEKQVKKFLDLLCSSNNNN